MEHSNASNESSSGSKNQPQSQMVNPFQSQMENQHRENLNTDQNHSCLAVNQLPLSVDMNEHRPLAFFGIKIHESPESIRSWVKWCKRQGFGGFNMIIATDCDGRANEKWLNMLMDAYEIALQAAQEEGLIVWIFDDWGYPSGTAGGLVCTEDAFRLKKLFISHDCTLNPGETLSLTIPEKIVSGGIYKSNDFKRFNLTPGQLYQHTAGNSPERLVIVAWEYDSHQAKSSCKSYPGDPAMSCIDMLNPKATQRFLEVMYDRYYQRFSKYFGTVIKGFFYDEPYISFESPWTDNLPEVFAAKKGYDLLEILPPLMVHLNQPVGGIRKYAEDFFDVWTDMAAENFYGLLSQWCKAHGVELSGHMDLDHHLNTLSTISGHFYKNMKCNDRPAVDVIWAQIEPDTFTDFPRYAGSVKRLLGRKHAVSETFAGMGQRLHGDLMRYITDHQAIRGIDDFHLMYSNNSPASPAESPQMPNHMLQEPFGRLIYERIATASAMASAGKSAVKTALYMPAYDLYRAQLGISQITINNAVQFPWEWVNAIAQALTYMPCDFDYIWDDAILNLVLTDGGIRTGAGNIIDTILLPPNCSLTDHVAQRLKEFQRLGGRIISVFRPNPLLESEALLCSELNTLKEYLPGSISISQGNCISLCTRLVDRKTVYLLLNESTKEADVEIHIDKEGTLCEYSLTDGALEMIPGNRPFQFTTHFSGCQLKVFIVDPFVAPLLSPHNFAASLSSPRNSAAPVSSTNFIAPQSPRKVDMKNGINPTGWSVEMPDNSRICLDGESWPDWTALGWPVYSGSMTYRAVFDWQCDSDNALISIPGLHYHALVFIDRKEVGRIAYKPYELFVNGLCKGHHELELVVYNTGANAVCGTIEAEHERYSKRFAHMAAFDRKWLKSGITEALTLYPMSLAR